MDYRRRILDDELDELVTGVAALEIVGPRAVGKTETASARARPCSAWMTPERGRSSKVTQRVLSAPRGRSSSTNGSGCLRPGTWSGVP